MKVKHKEALKYIEAARKRINEMFDKLVEKNTFISQDTDKAYELMPLENYVKEQIEKDYSILLWAYNVLNIAGYTRTSEEIELTKIIKPKVLELIDTIGLTKALNKLKDTVELLCNNCGKYYITYEDSEYHLPVDEAICPECDGSLYGDVIIDND